MFVNNGFYREGLLAPRPTPKLEDHPSSAVRDCLFNLFAATLLTGGGNPIHNLRTRRGVVTGTHQHSGPTLLHGGMGELRLYICSLYARHYKYFRSTNSSAHNSRLVPPSDLLTHRRHNAVRTTTQAVDMCCLMR